MGHICRNRAGELLFPGSMCTVIGDIRDKFYECTEGHILTEVPQSSKRHEYEESLRKLLMSKEGIIRGKCCSGFVGWSFFLRGNWLLTKSFSQDTSRTPS